MKMDHIDISGITLESNLPKCPYNYPYKEVCETYNLSMPNHKPPIKTILEIYIDTSIEKSHILNTPLGKKLVIYGNIHFKILYVSNISSESVHSAHFDLPLSTFIGSNIYSEIENVNLYIQDAFIKQLDSKNFFISMITLVYPVLKEQDTHHSNNFNRKAKNYIKITEHPDTDSTLQFGSFPSDYHNLKSNVTSSNNHNTSPNKHHEIENDTISSKPFELEFDMNSNINPEIQYHINSSDLECDIEYEMNYDIKHEINSDNNMDINPDQKREYYEYDWE